MAEATIRLGVFVLVLLLMLAAEAIWPRRKRSIDLLVRWPGNFGAAMLGTVLVRLLLPASAVGVAIAAQESGLGLFNLATLPGLITICLTVALMDLAIYAQHRAFHRIPALWRLHRMHHTDLDIDASTGLRFHPFELLLSMLIKLAVIIIIGAPPVAVLTFEVLLNASSIFNHSNLRLHATVDRLLRNIIVTPDMHRVHHSTINKETNSNYGFFLSWWDHLFGSYISQPKLGHENMNIGLKDFREPENARLDRMLVNPFL